MLFMHFVIMLIFNRMEGNGTSEKFVLNKLLNLPNVADFRLLRVFVKSWEETPFI